MPNSRISIGAIYYLIAARKKALLLSLVAILLVASTALADSYRVSYSLRGSGRKITVQAESSAEARRTVMQMFGRNCLVTGVHKIKD